MCWISANWRGELGSEYYPTVLHSEQRDVTCLSKYLTFSNWGNRQKHRALFFKAPAQCVFRHVCNTAFLPISSLLDTIYYLQEKRMTSVHLVMRTDEKACLPPTLPTSPSPVRRPIWSSAPFTVWKFRCRHSLNNSSIGLQQPQKLGFWGKLTPCCSPFGMSHTTAGKKSIHGRGKRKFFKFVVKTCHFCC